MRGLREAQKSRAVMFADLDHLLPNPERDRKAFESVHATVPGIGGWQDWGVAEVRRLKVLEEENRKLRQLVADLSLDKQMLQDVLRKKP